MLESIKSFSSYIVSCVVEGLCSTHTTYLPPSARHIQLSLESGSVRAQFDTLSAEQKGQVYYKVWELAKKDDSTIAGDRWGEAHVFDNLPRLHRALSRLGFMPAPEEPRPITCLSYTIGEGGIGSQYFSLSERAHKEYRTGQVGYVNGMGVPSLEHAGRDAVGISDQFADGNNIHCVYNSTHQNRPVGDLFGFLIDVLRMKAIDGGSYGKTSYLTCYSPWLATGTPLRESLENRRFSSIIEA